MEPKKVRTYQGKRVVLTTNRGTIYSGLLHVSSDDSVILCDIGIHDKDGNLKVKSKQSESRKFRTSNIYTIREGMNFEVKEYVIIVCSHCGEKTRYINYFCPNCGKCWHIIWH